MVHSLFDNVLFHAKDWEEELGTGEREEQVGGMRDQARSGGGRPNASPAGSAASERGIGEDRQVLLRRINDMCEEV